MNAYRASKTLAEKAAWEFVTKEKPKFELCTCNPPLVFGPVVHYLNSLSSVNTSNLRVRDIITGAAKEKCPVTGGHLWVDVRDIALAHVLAMEKDGAAGKRFFITAGHFSNREIVEIIRDSYPDLKDKLPEGEALKSGDYPAEGYHGYNNTRSTQVLGLTYRPLEEAIVDTVKSLQAVGA